MVHDIYCTQCTCRVKIMPCLLMVTFFCHVCSQKYPISQYLLALYNNNSLAYSVACFHTSNQPVAFVYEPSSLALHNITSSAASFTLFVYSLLEIIPPNLNNLKIQCFFSGLPHRKAVSIAFPHFMDQRFGAIPTAEVAFGCTHIQL